MKKLKNPIVQQKKRDNFLFQSLAAARMLNPLAMDAATAAAIASMNASAMDPTTAAAIASINAQAAAAQATMDATAATLGVLAANKSGKKMAPFVLKAVGKEC